MIVSASYLFPVEPRLVLGKEIEKSGFYSSLEHSVLLFSRVWLGLMGLLISLVRQDGSKSHAIHTLSQRRRTAFFILRVNVLHSKVKQAKERLL